MLNGDFTADRVAGVQRPAGRSRSPARFAGNGNRIDPVALQLASR